MKKGIVEFYDESSTERDHAQICMIGDALIFASVSELDGQQRNYRRLHPTVVASPKPLLLLLVNHRRHLLLVVADGSSMEIHRHHPNFRCPSL